MSLSSARLRHAGLVEIADKRASNERLSLADGVRLFETPDLLAVGWLANREREKRHGSRTYFHYNNPIEATKIRRATCPFPSVLPAARAREAPRCADLLHLQHPHRSDERLRRHLPVLFVLPAAPRRSRVVHAIARRGLGKTAPPRPSAAHGGPRRQRAAPRPSIRLLQRAPPR